MAASFLDVDPPQLAGDPGYLSVIEYPGMASPTAGTNVPGAADVLHATDGFAETPGDLADGRYDGNEVTHEEGSLLGFGPPCGAACTASLSGPPIRKALRF